MPPQKPSPLRERILRWVFILVVLACLFLGLVPTPHRRITDQARRAQAKVATSQLVAALRQYTTEYGNPLLGSNAEVMKGLMGANPRQIIFFETRTTDINDKGEFIDPWGTPYSFDLSDPKNPRIWSSGKDRRNDGGAEGSDDIPNWR